MLASTECTNTDLKDSQLLALTTCLSKLDKNKTSVHETVKGLVVKIIQTHTNTILRASTRVMLSYLLIFNPGM